MDSRLAHDIHKRTRRKVEGPAISINLPALRVEVRTPPPPTKSTRSGSVVVDIHDLRLSPGEAPEQGGAPTARFGTAEDMYGHDGSSQGPRGSSTVLLGASWKRIVVSYAATGEPKARAILSLGPLGSSGGEWADFGVGSPPPLDAAGQGLRPQLVVRRAQPSTADVSNHTAISIDLPSIHVELSKHTLDGLQFWADDLTQLMERAFAEGLVLDSETQRAGSGDSSIIGSRYFARASTVGSGTESGRASLANTIRAKQELRSETAVKIAITEGPFIRRRAVVVYSRSWLQWPSDYWLLEAKASKSCVHST